MKTVEFTRRFFFHALDPFDVRTRRPDFAPAQERLQAALAAFYDHHNAAVRRVANPAAHPERAGLFDGGGSIEHALHASANDEMEALHVRLWYVAEGEGFEPTRAYRSNGFQDRRIQPLCHPSSMPTNPGQYQILIVPALCILRRSSLAPTAIITSVRLNFDVDGNPQSTCPDNEHVL